MAEINLPERYKQSRIELETEILFGVEHILLFRRTSGYRVNHNILNQFNHFVNLRLESDSDDWRPMVTGLVQIGVVCLLVSVLVGLVQLWYS